MNADQLLANYERIAGAPNAVQRLRSFILDLAVRGKLVPQDLNDAPASELLKQISAEKARLVKSGEMNHPKAPPTPLAEIPPFTLPDNWRWSQIAEIGVLSPRNQAEDDAVASFVPMALIPTEYGMPSAHEIRYWREIKKGYTHFAEGDVGLAKITPCFENGKSTVFRSLTGGLGSGTTELHIVRPLFVDPMYVLLFLKSPRFIATGVPKMTGTAGQKRLPAGHFANAPFPFPPLAEQRRIVAKVDELMVLCDQLEATRGEQEAARNHLTAMSLDRLNTPDPNPSVFQNDAEFALVNLDHITAHPDQIKAVRQTILNLAVRGKLVSQELSNEDAAPLVSSIKQVWDARKANGKVKKPKVWSALGSSDTPFEVPSNWALVRLGQAMELINGRAFKPTDWTPKGMPIVRIQNLNNPTADFNRFDGDVKNQFLIDTGDFLISWSGTPGTSFGAHIWDRGPAILNQHIFKAVLIGNAFAPHFLKLAINSRLLEMIEQAHGGVGLQHITKPKLEAVVLTLPPLAEQHRIVAKVDELMNLCDQLEVSLTTVDDTCRELLDALLQETLEPATTTQDDLAAEGKRRR